MQKILAKSFFEKPTVEVAKNLLGKFLVRSFGKAQDKKMVVMIIEVEAYDGFKDRASHAHRGKTARNAVMFGEAGVWYVYFTYGMHWMLNVVTGQKDYPAAVLIRGIAGVNDGRHLHQQNVMNGPGKLTKFLKIDKKLNGKEANRKSGLWIEDRRIYPDSHGRIRIAGAKGGSALFVCRKSSRVGVNYAGKYWASRRYRFYLEI